jgi:hypothetical protein
MRRRCLARSARRLRGTPVRRVPRVRAAVRQGPAVAARAPVGHPPAALVQRAPQAQQVPQAQRVPQAPVRTPARTAAEPLRLARQHTGLEFQQRARGVTAPVAIFLASAPACFPLS